MRKVIQLAFSRLLANCGEGLVVYPCFKNHVFCRPDPRNKSSSIREDTILELATVPSKSALIVKFGQIGDVVMAIPSVRLLFEQGYEIQWVCGKAALPLLECYSWINVIPLNDKAILLGPLPSRLRAIAHFWSRVLVRRYTLCATLYFDRRFHLLTLPVRAQRKIQLSRESRGTAFLAGRHHTDECVRLLLGLKDGCREKSVSPVLPDRLPPSPLQSKKAARRVALVPGGTRNVLGEQALRRWPLANFVAVGEQLIDRGWEVVLVGGPEDVWVRPSFEHLSVTDCLGRFSLPEVISAFDTCDAVLTHDTGPLHLSGLSGTCVVGVFGPTDPATRVPRRTDVVGIWGGQGFACRPCYDGRDFAPCEFNGCMHQVTPGLVLRELDLLLAARDQGKSVDWHVVAPGDL